MSVVTQDMFQNPYEPGAPFPHGNQAQQHVEYLPLHDKPEGDRTSVTHLHIDNRDRMTSFDAQRGNSAPFNFSVKFPPIHNVIAVELKTISCPKPATESYVILDIAQLADQLRSSDDNADQRSGILYFDQFEPSTEVKPVKSDLMSCNKIHFDAPLTLSRMDVCIRLYGGDVMVPAVSGSTKVSMLFDVTSQDLSATYGI